MVHEVVQSLMGMLDNRVGKLRKADGWRVGVEDTVHVFLHSETNPLACGDGQADANNRTRNVSPMIHAGKPSPGGGAPVPWVRSKIAPMHCPLLREPTLRSATLIGHAGPPKDIATVS